MARSKQTRGVCGYCAREFAKGGMQRHLRTCRSRTEAVAESDRKRGRAGKLVHIRVSDAWIADFWLDLEMQGSATLQDLDRYLRAIWLECCGHLSVFVKGDWTEENELPVKTRVDQVLQPDEEIMHIYDFGTSSETRVRGVAVRDGSPTTSHPIALMARNNPLEVMCMECDGSAVCICIECVYEYDTDGLLCSLHEESHAHRNYGDPMPVVNSPRVGVCGYVGPAEPPY